MVETEKDALIKIVEKQLEEYCEENKYILQYETNVYENRYFFEIKKDNKILIKGIYDCEEEIVVCTFNYHKLNKNDIVYDSIDIYNIDNFFDFLYDKEIED